MTFPNSLIAAPLKDTTKDVFVNPQFYCNGSDLNIFVAELLGIQRQLGLSAKLDIIAVGNSLNLSGPSQITIGGVIVSVGSGSETFSTSGVFFVWIDDAGVINQGAALPTTTNYLPVAQVTTTTGGVITAVADLRPWLSGTGGGGGGGSFPATYRATTTEPRYARRDVAVTAATDFLPGGLSPISDAAYFDIDVCYDANAELVLIQIEGITRSEMILGSVVANELAHFRVQAPLRYDGGGTDIQYQMQFDVTGTAEFLGIMEIEFDAEMSTAAAAGTGTVLIPFQIAFAFDDASPVTLFSLLAGDVLTECEVVIQTAFDDVAATLQVGVSGDADAILGINEIDADFASQYGEIADRTSAISELLLLTISPAGATAGSGYVAGIVRR